MVRSDRNVNERKLHSAIASIAGSAEPTES